MRTGCDLLCEQDVRARGQTGAAVSTDLVHWRRLSGLEASARPHEAPNAFNWRG